MVNNSSSIYIVIMACFEADVEYCLQNSIFCIFSISHKFAATVCSSILMSARSSRL